ncbi:antibiotic biosynthesis monooxygenase family protein [Staphylococcus ratti]|uniref:Signal transduction protein TRAP n=1 Tax=Staphylococcus ratti TaxID=2892440 RepID=A0ABY3PBH3_9STAP|nr:antibiotic biosynthesis monooxygenase [Staphylococcus ratti]UEX89641.1 antibiotic biosynthesis monooxygenase [Staphylococcus ratti]
MFVAQVTFSTKDLESRSILDNKAKHAKKDFEGYEGLIAVEVWKNETKDKLEYAIVSKWHDKKDFQAWVSRPEHVEEHKNKNQTSKVQEEAKYSAIDKQIKKYECVE